MENIIELRGHHLGIIYEVIAIKEAQKLTDVKLCISKHLQRWYDQFYPIQTINEGGDILDTIFCDTQKPVFISIVLGPDDICKSGCIESKEKGIKNKKIPSTIKERLKNTLTRCCCNKNLSLDTDMLRIFKLRAGKTYSSDKVLKIIMGVYKEYQTNTWNKLIKEYKNES